MVCALPFSYWIICFRVHAWSSSQTIFFDSFIFGSLTTAIAWALGMVSLGAISLGSFQTGAILLAGLFCYDIFWVFGTDVMMTVATKGENWCWSWMHLSFDKRSKYNHHSLLFQVEAPVKFLYTSPPSDVPRSYPFSVLGLGDGKRIWLH